MITEEDIIKAYSKIRTIDNTIPDDVLDFIKNASIKQLRIADVSKSIDCDHPRSERSYIGGNLLRCNKCGKEFS